MAATIDRAQSARFKGIIQQEVSTLVADFGADPTRDDMQNMIIQAVADNASASGFSEQDIAVLEQEIVDDMLNLGPLQSLLTDPTITEICVNSSSDIFVERGGLLERADIAFDGEAHLRRIIDQIAQGVNRHVDEQSPLLDARLADGSRVNTVIKPIALGGSSLTIRRFPEHRLTFQDIIDRKSASPAMLGFLAAAVEGRCNIVVAGGTGGGKTTLLNVLSSSIPDDERIITIEDVAELDFNHDNIIRLEARPANSEGSGEISIHDLVVNALRMRPDRIVVGECRKKEALEMIRSMTTGHDGSLTTVHANDVETVYQNLENMILEAVPSYDHEVCRRIIAQAIDLVVLVNRKKGGARIIESITAVSGMEGTTIQSEPLFEFKQTGIASDHTPAGTFRGCGSQHKKIISRIEEWGATYDPEWMFDEYERA